MIPYRGNLPWLVNRTIFFGRHGSHAYGLNIETSDEDFKGVAVPPPEYTNGFLRKFEQAESKEPDMVVFDIRKFMALAADCNPNIIEVLFSEPMLITWAGEMYERSELPHSPDRVGLDALCVNIVTRMNSEAP